MPGVVSEYADKLIARLEEEGPIDKGDIRVWLTEEQLEPKFVNLVLGQGKTRWHEENGYLVPGTAHKEQSTAPPPQMVEDPLAMESPKEVFQAMAINLGVPERPASTAAYFCFQNYDMGDPAKAWEAINRTQITPVLKKPVWRTWLSYIDVTPPPELVVEVENTTRPAGAQIQAPSAGGGRRFVAMSGEVVPTETDDSTGMSFGEALRVAQLQLEKMQLASEQSPAESSLLQTFIQESGETQRALINNPADTGTSSLMSEISSQRREMDLRLGAQEERRRHEAELAQVKEDARWKESQEREDRRTKEFTEVLKSLVDRKPTNPFSALDDMMPGLSKKVLENVFNPPHMMPGPNGGAMSVDDYERVQGVEIKKDAIRTVKDAIPQLLGVAQDLAAATDRAYDKVMSERAQTEESEETRRVPEGAERFNTYCASCMRVLYAPPEVEKFECHFCGVRQNRAGELLEVEGQVADRGEYEEGSEFDDFDNLPATPEVLDWNPYMIDPSPQPTAPSLPETVEELRVDSPAPVKPPARRRRRTAAARAEGATS